MLLRFPYDEKLYLLIEIFLGLSVFIAMIISIFGYLELDFSIRALSDITINWEGNPIIDLSNSRGCQDGNTPLITDQWEGTNEGCDCLYRYDDIIPWEYRNNVNLGVCKLNMTLGGCRTIPPLNPIILSKWRNANLCANTLKKNYTELHKNSVRSSNYCKNGLKQCGKLDTIGNLLCLSSNEKCPINKILIQASQVTPPSDFNYTQIVLGDNFMLYYTNEAINENILTDVRLSEGDACINPREHNTNFPGKSYKLERYYNNYGCQFKVEDSSIDSRYVKIDNYAKKELFIDNGILNLLQILPQYPMNNLNTNFGMYIRPYIGWRFYSTGSSDDDLAAVTNISSSIQHISTFKLMNMIFFIFVFVFFLFQIFFKWESIIKLNFLESIFVTLSLVNFIISIACLRNNNFSLNFKGFDEGDDITNSIFMNFGAMLDSAYGKDMTLMIFSLFNFSLYPLCLVIQYFGDNRQSSDFTDQDKLA